MSTINTGIFIGGARDGTRIPLTETREAIRMPAPLGQLPRPSRGAICQQPTRSIEAEVYLRSEWHAEEGVTLIYYRHESLTYADTILMLLERYVR